MRLSPQGLRLIASFEGFVPRPYNDAADNATIGYGHLLHAGHVTPADLAQWGTITTARALELLNVDAQAAEHAVSRTVRVLLGIIPRRAQARYDALVSLAFNIGAGAFAGSSLAAAINRKGAPRDWHTVAPYWLEWDHAGGRIIPGLLTRRTRELAIFVPGRYPPG